MPRCKVCKKQYKPQRPLQTCCSPLCAIELSKNKKEVQNAEKKLANKWKREVRIKHRTHGWYENTLQDLINWIARRIDYGQQCISHTGKQSKINAGHYHTVGSNNSIRFNLLQIWIQCEHCNTHLSSNRTGYDAGLKRLFDHERWLYINEGIIRDYPIVKMSIPELMEKIKIASKIKKRLEAADPEILSAEQRWSMRVEINKEIAIYTV